MWTLGFDSNYLEKSQFWVNYGNVKMEWVWGDYKSRSGAKNKVNSLYAFTNSFIIITMKILIVTHPTLQSNYFKIVGWWICQQIASLFFWNHSFYLLSITHYKNLKNSEKQLQVGSTEELPYFSFAVSVVWCSFPGNESLFMETNGIEIHVPAMLIKQKNRYTL